jgi:hypothetical protein
VAQPTSGDASGGLLTAQGSAVDSAASACGQQVIADGLAQAVNQYFASTAVPASAVGSAHGRRVCNLTSVPLSILFLTERTLVPSLTLRAAGGEG